MRTLDDTPTPTVAPDAAPCPVAETMRHVHALLRAGTAPSLESLLAYGVPGSD